MNNQLAQITNPVIPGAIGSGGSTVGPTVLGNLVAALIGLGLIGGFLLAMFFLVTGAVLWITSGGDKNSLENARNRIIHALVGLIILASVWAIMSLVSTFLGLGFPKLPFPTLTGGGGGSANTSSFDNNASGNNLQSSNNAFENAIQNLQNAIDTGFGLNP